MAGVCDRAPDFLSPTGNQALGPALGSVVALNCTAWVVSGPHCPLPSVQWLKDRLPLGNGSHYSLHEDSWVKDNLSEVLVSSVLGVNLTHAEDYGTFTCTIRNVSSSPFTLWRAGPAGHVAAVLASLLVLLALLLAALLYVKCRLNVLLWYQDAYGEVEVNDGKLYDAYVSYSDSPEDRKFVNFILKPQLERRRGYKLFLDDRDLLPRAEPSADLLVNLSRCRRLIVVLSEAFLGRAWCSHSFREGLCRLLELTRRPIFITFEGQRRDPVHPALHLLRQHRHLVTLLLWRPGSAVRRGAPSSDFWKELQLALPRKVRYRATEGDPQTQLQDDKDPMLIVQGHLPAGRTLHLELDPDPEGDLGVRGPIFGEPLAPPHASGVSLGEGRGSEVDVSDLGSRNYSARTDFYCLVSEEDV
ncbi:Single Ig IL-1-related receptor [Vulpes lagopus]